MRFVVTLALLASLGCGTLKPVPTPQNATCAEACQHGSALKCDWAEPTKNGATCLEFCRATMDDGPIVLPLDCLASAPSCAVARECR